MTSGSTPPSTSAATTSTVLAQLLDLDDDSLEIRLRRLLRLSEREAAALARRLRRNRVAARLGLGVLTAVPAVEALVGADRAVASPDSAGAVAEAVDDDDHGLDVHDGGAAPPSPSPVPAPAPEATVADASEPAPAPVDVGYAVRYERDPEFVPPPGVDIGDAMFIERDAPPLRSRRRMARGAPRPHGAGHDRNPRERSAMDGAPDSKRQDGAPDPTALRARQESA